MDKTTQGAWILHHTNKLDRVTGSGDFENITLAGKAGILLSSLSASSDTELSTAKVDALAKAAGIHAKLELPGLLDTLATHRFIERDPKRVSTLGLTAAALLAHTTEIFVAQSPLPEEIAVLELAEDVSKTPGLERDLMERLGDTHRIGSKRLEELFRDARQIGFVDAEELDSDNRLLFNGNLFRRESAGKIHAVLSSLTPADQARVREVDELLRSRGCLEMSAVEQILTKRLFEKLNAISFYDVNELSNSVETVYYVTRPAAFGKYGDPFLEDALDLAKAFVACLSYGMTRRKPRTGRITMLKQLVRRLLAGDEVGPATAIGEDYRVLELKRVIVTRPEGDGRYHMRLLKKEVGELALQVLTEGDASEQSLENLPSAAAARYAPPERVRERVRKRQRPASKREVAEVLRVLRTGS